MWKSEFSSVSKFHDFKQFLLYFFGINISTSQETQGHNSKIQLRSTTTATLKENQFRFRAVLAQNEWSFFAIKFCIYNWCSLSVYKWFDRIGHLCSYVESMLKQIFIPLLLNVILKFYSFDENPFRDHNTLFLKINALYTIDLYL